MFPRNYNPGLLASSRRQLAQRSGDRGHRPPPPPPRDDHGRAIAGAGPPLLRRRCGAARRAGGGGRRRRRRRRGTRAHAHEAPAAREERGGGREAVPGERDAGGGDRAAVHAVGALHGRHRPQHLQPAGAQPRAPARAHARRRQEPGRRGLHVHPGRRRLAPAHQPRPRRHQGQRRHVHGEGEHLADARVRHRGGRRRRQDGGAVGRHGGHGRVLGQAHGHVPLRHVRRQLHVLRRQEHHLQEHGPRAAARRAGQAGGGAADIGGQRRVRGVQLPGRAGHAVRPPRPPLLPGLLHRGLRRLHLRQRALPLRGVPCARDRAELRRADGAKPAEPAGGHGVLVRELPGDGVRRALPGPRLGHLLPRRLRLHLHGQHHHPARLVQLGRPDAGDDGVLRAVQVHGAGRELRRQGAVVAGAHRRGGQALHLALLHRRPRVAPVVARHIVQRDSLLTHHDLN